MPGNIYFNSSKAVLLHSTRGWALLGPPWPFKARAPCAQKKVSNYKSIESTVNSCQYLQQDWKMSSDRLHLFLTMLQKGFETCTLNRNPWQGNRSHRPVTFF